MTKAILYSMTSHSLSPIRKKTAPKVSEKLAKIVNLRWFTKLNETNLKEKSDKYLRPKKCDRLIIPKINPEI